MFNFKKISMKKKEFIEAILAYGKDKEATGFNNEVQIFIIQEADLHGGYTTWLYDGQELNNECGTIFCCSLSEAWKYRNKVFANVFDFGFEGQQEDEFTLEYLIQAWWDNFNARKEATR